MSAFIRNMALKNNLKRRAQVYVKCIYKHLRSLLRTNNYIIIAENVGTFLS